MSGIISNSESLVDDVTKTLPFNTEDILERVGHPYSQRTQLPRGCPRYLKKTRGDYGRWASWPKTNKRGTEKQLCKYLNALAENVRENLGHPRSADDLVYSTEFSINSPSCRPPDLVVVPRSQRNTGKVIDIRSYAFLNVSARYRSSERSQIMELAKLCFSVRSDRRHILAFGFCHTGLTLYYLDHSGLVYSKTHDIHQEPDKFLRVAIGILFMDRTQLGFDVAMTIKDNNFTLSVDDDDYELTEVIHSVPGTLKPQTIFYSAKCTKGLNVGKVCVIKDTWVEHYKATRELEILKYIRGKVPNVTQLLAGGIVKVSAGNDEVLDNTGLFCGSSPSVDILYRYRISITPYGAPLTNFASLIELVSATLDVIEGIDALDKIGILHRDISIGNIVLAADGTSDVRKGYIIDFDHALRTFVPEERIQLKLVRMGTLPFMAIDVLNTLSDHSARHDAESMFYVLIWIAIARGGPNRLKRPNFNIDDTVLGEWETVRDGYGLTDVSLRKQRSVEYEHNFVQRVLKAMHPYFQPLAECLLNMRGVLFPNDYVPRKPREILSMLKDVLKATIEKLRNPEPVSIGEQSQQQASAQNNAPTASSDSSETSALNSNPVPDPAPVEPTTPVITDDATPSIQEVLTEIEGPRLPGEGDSMKNVETQREVSTPELVTPTGKRGREEEQHESPNKRLKLSVADI